VGRIRAAPGGLPGLVPRGQGSGSRGMSTPSTRPVQREHPALAALAAAEYDRVLLALERFADTGAGEVKPLRGRASVFRLGVGDWRAVFAYDGARAELVVERVANRRD